MIRMIVREGYKGRKKRVKRKRREGKGEKKGGVLGKDHHEKDLDLGRSEKNGIEKEVTDEEKIEKMRKRRRKSYRKKRHRSRRRKERGDEKGNTRKERKGKCE